MEDNWDLRAVVRGMIGAADPSSGAAAPSSSHGGSCFTDQMKHLFSLPNDPFYPKSCARPPQQLHAKATFSCFPNHRVYKSFLNLKSAFSSPEQGKIMAPSVSMSRDVIHEFNTRLRHHFAVSEPTMTSPMGNGGTVSRNSQDNRSKRSRKNVAKVVKNVGPEDVCSDVWSWRKYGQKPIKGSPYPRGYYRCSTSKECMARKQVERNRSDPRKFTLTYTGDHTHSVPAYRNCLAGKTRRKKPSPSSPLVSVKIEQNLTPSDMNVDDDDLFAGLDDLHGLFSVDSFAGSRLIVGALEVSETSR